MSSQSPPWSTPAMVIGRACAATVAGSCFTTVTRRRPVRSPLVTPAEPVPAPAWGLVLAGGAGRRFGGPKALARSADGTPWLHRVVMALRDGGCSGVIVVLGAEADAARSLVPPGARVVVAGNWEAGLSASLRVGLEALAATDADVGILSPVDVPTLPAAVVSRVIRAAPGASSLVRATYAGAPGHPVAIGRDHWMPIAASVSGDTGAAPYLRTHGAVELACDELWDGADIDERRP